MLPLWLFGLGIDGLGRTCLPVPSRRSSEATRIVGERIRSHRERLGLSQEKLAERADLHWTYIGQVERGARNLGLHNIIRIAGALGINPGELVTGLSPVDVAPGTA